MSLSPKINIYTRKPTSETVWGEDLPRLRTPEFPRKKVNSLCVESDRTISGWKSLWPSDTDILRVSECVVVGEFRWTRIGDVPSIESVVASRLLRMFLSDRPSATMVNG